MMKRKNRKYHSFKRRCISIGQKGSGGREGSLTRLDTLNPYVSSIGLMGEYEAGKDYQATPFDGFSFWVDFARFAFNTFVFYK